VPDRKAFLLRVDPALLESLQKWADDELRSLNGQIEWILRRALTDHKRIEAEEPPAPTPPLPGSTDSDSKSL
jgi:hypothetical protein